jgi:C1A family cysteine protease
MRSDSYDSMPLEDGYGASGNRERVNLLPQQNQEKKPARSYPIGVPVVVILCIAFITVATLNFSRPFTPNGYRSDSDAHLSSLAVAHEALNLYPDSDGRYQYSGLSDEAKEVLFDAFASTYKKSYDDQMRMQRFAAFRESLSKINERNEKEKAAGGTACHGITKFSDWTEDEFQSMYLKSTKSYAKGKGRLLKDTSSTKKAAVDEESSSSSSSSSKKGEKTEKTVTITSKKKADTSAEGDDTSSVPDSVDWTGVYTTKVKDQGYCGACWAFAVSEQLESDGIRLGLFDTNTVLSPQQIISCDTEAVGCSGGWTESAYNYVAAAGISLETQYPFTAYMEKEMTSDSAVCESSSIKGVLSVAGYYSLVSEEDMIEYVKTTGPLSICVDSTEWSSYVKGIVKSCPSNANHCVQAVGVTTSKNGQGYWKVRNSWGEEWGEDGYIRLAVGANVCDITYDPTFTEPFLV